MQQLVSFLLALMLAAPVAAAGNPAPETKTARYGGPRVRANDGRSASVLLEGLNRSETMRHLVDELEARDVIVYVEIQPFLARRLAGSLTWVTATKSVRYVRVSLNPDLSGDALVATLGHELQHAVEVAREPSIVSTNTLVAYYAKNGMSMNTHVSGWDTEAARQAGDDVRREIAVARTSRATESIQDLDADWHIAYRRGRSMLPP